MKATPSPYFELIEKLTRKLADARNVVIERVQSLRDEIESAKRRRIPGIKTSVASAKQAESDLASAIAEHRSEFAEPRTVVLHGLKVGIAKGRGKNEWADEAVVIARIEKFFPEQADVLIKTEKTIRKKALGGLSVAELKKIGVTIVEADDAVYIAPADDEVDKLVNRLLKGEDSAE